MAEKELAEMYPGWKTVRKIGVGSFGTVYEIERDLFGRTEKAALKVITIPQNEGDVEDLYSNGYDDASITAHFKGYLADIVREYSLMAEMKGHTNVVYCDDIRYIQHDDGFGWDIYIKMELLTSMVKALSKEVSEEQVIKLGTDLCNALILCRGKNIVHRDIKPQNIFVSSTGDFKLGDFGIAKTIEQTTGGTKIGTYNYMAPEVYNNQPYGSAADIYSLGLVMYWLLNERRLPFLPLPPKTPTSAEVEASRLRRFSGEPIPAPKNGCAELKRIVLKACAYDPRNRYADPQQMRWELMALEGKEVQLPEVEEGTLVDGAQTKQTTEDATMIMFDPRAAAPFRNNQAVLSQQTGDPAHTGAIRNHEPSVRAEETLRAAFIPEPAPKSSSVPGKRKLLLLAAAVLVLVIGSFCWLLFGKLLPDAQYSKAMALLEAGEYEKAADVFEALNGYQDSAQLLETARLESRYAAATELLAAEKYEEAIAAFEALNGYRDSAQQLETARYALQIIELRIKTTYCLGDTLDADSLGLTAVYGSGKMRAVSSGFTCSPTVLSEAGTQEVTVSYEGITETFAVEVLDFYELEARVANNRGEGYNKNGKVNWVLYITARYNGNYVQAAYEHNMGIRGAFSGDWVALWNSATQGRGAEWSYSCDTSFEFGKYHAGGAVVLPDDPNFAGQYSATVSFGDVSKTVTFTLTYKGDYSSGTGWRISDVRWE